MILMKNLIINLSYSSIRFRNQNIISNNILAYLSAYWFLLLKDRIGITGIHPQHSLIKSIDVFSITRISKFQTSYRQHRFMSISNHIYRLLFWIYGQWCYLSLSLHPDSINRIWREWIFGLNNEFLTGN